MPAEVFKVVQYAAACTECQWYGELFYEFLNHREGKPLAEAEMDKHNKKLHPNTEDS